MNKEKLVFLLKNNRNYLFFIVPIILIFLIILFFNRWSFDYISEDWNDIIYQWWQRFFNIILPDWIEILADYKFYECFNSRDTFIELEYQDIILRNYLISDFTNDCIVDINNWFNSFEIKRWDLYLNINNKLVLYNSSRYVADNIIKIGWQN